MTKSLKVLKNKQMFVLHTHQNNYLQDTQKYLNYRGHFINTDQSFNNATNRYDMSNDNFGNV